jgi:hypothetical protein
VEPNPELEPRDKPEDVPCDVPDVAPEVDPEPDPDFEPEFEPDALLPLLVADGLPEPAGVLPVASCGLDAPQPTASVDATTAATRYDGFISGSSNGFSATPEMASTWHFERNAKFGIRLFGSWRRAKIGIALHAPGGELRRLLAAKSQCGRMPDRRHREKSSGHGGERQVFLPAIGLQPVHGSGRY